MEKNIIILKTPYKITKAFLNPCKNPKTGRYPDSVRKVDTKGEMILSREDIDSGKSFIAETDIIEITNGKIYNLDDPYEAAEWEAIKYHSLIAHARDERDANNELVIDGNMKKYGTADWYVEVPGKEAQEKNTRRRKIIEAQNYIVNDEPSARRIKAQVLGKYVNGMHESDIEDYLMQEAEKNYNKIIDLYTGGDMSIRILFMKCKEEKIIQFKDKLWIYGESILGATEDAAILWMKQPSNQKILNLIQREVYPELFTVNKDPND